MHASISGDSQAVVYSLGKRAIGVSVLVCLTSVFCAWQFYHGARIMAGSINHVSKSIRDADRHLVRVISVSVLPHLKSVSDFLINIRRIFSRKGPF